MPANITDDPTVFPTVTNPIDADTLNAASIAATTQELANRTAYLNSRVQIGQLLEGFEGATFPPQGVPGTWTSPSKRYLSDSAFTRTTNPTPASVLTGSASALGSGSSDTSLGLDFYVEAPSRMTFLFMEVIDTSSTGAKLQFYIDGVLTANLGSPNTNTQTSGKWVSDILPRGLHTFDWRFIPNQPADFVLLDHVTITPESMWLEDIGSRFWLWDDFFAPAVSNLFSTSHGSNAGTAVQADSELTLSSAGTANGDYEALSMNVQSVGVGNTAAYETYAELGFFIPFSVVNGLWLFGFWDKTTNNMVALGNNAGAWFVQAVNSGSLQSSGTLSLPSATPALVANTKMRVGMSLAKASSGQIESCCFQLGAQTTGDNFPGQMSAPSFGLTATKAFFGAHWPSTWTGMTPFIYAGNGATLTPQGIIVDYFKMFGMKNNDYTF